MSFCHKEQWVHLNKKTTIFILAFSIVALVTAQSDSTYMTATKKWNTCCFVPCFCLSFNDSTIKRYENLQDDVFRVFTNHCQPPVYVQPFFSWNDYDGLYPGIGLFNSPLSSTKFKYSLFPAWSFSTNSLIYSGAISFRIPLTYSKSGLTELIPFIKSQTMTYNYIPGFFLNYSTYKGGFKLNIPNNKHDKTNHSITFSSELIKKQQLEWNTSDSMYHKNTIQYSLFSLKYEGAISQIGDREKQEFFMEGNGNMMKISFSTSHFFQYNSPRKGLHIRAFAGTFIFKKLPSAIDYRFRMNGTHGPDDYGFSLPFLARSDIDYGLMANQIYPNDGFFKINTPVGQTWDQLFALNIKTDIPGFLPLQLYADFATYTNAGSAFQGSTILPWNAGVVIAIIRDKIEIYLPLFMSEDIKQVYAINNLKFINRISWMIRFDEMNILKVKSN